jgi:hypothetical protein
MKHALKSFVPNLAFMLAIALVGNTIGQWLVPSPAGARLTVEAVSITPLAGAGRIALGSGSTSLSPILAVAGGSRLTYQGRLLAAGRPVTGQYDFVFTRWDARSGGTRYGLPTVAGNQPVVGGLATVILAFDPSASSDAAGWLQVEVRATGAGTYTTLAPRQPLTTTP